VQGGFNLRQFQDWVAFQRTWLQTDVATKEGARMAANARRTLNRSLSTNPAISPIRSLDRPSAQPASTMSLIVLLQVNEISFICVLGQSVGKATLTIDRLSSTLRSVPTDSRTIGVSVDSLRVKFGPVGKLAGYINVERTGLQTIVKDIAPTSTASRTDIISMRFHVGRIKGALDVDHRRLTLFNNDPFLVSIIDDWSSSIGHGTDAPSLGVSFSVKLGELRLALTSNTVPTFLLLFREVQTAISDARSRATSDSPTSFVAHPPSDRFHLDMAARAGIKPLLDQIAIIRHMHFEAKQFLVVGFLHNFSNPEAWAIRTRAIKASLSVDGSEESIHRTVSLDVLPVNVDKIHLKSITPSEETAMSAEDWVAAFDAARRTSLTQIPAGHGQQESWQRQQTLEYKSDVRFVGDLDVSYSAQSYMSLWNVSRIRAGCWPADVAIRMRSCLRPL
jgi:hypothetical protein